MAYQFGFHIRNPGQDDKLGSYDQDVDRKGRRTTSVSTRCTTIRLDMTIITSENQLTLPVGRPVNIILRSRRT